MSPFDGTPFQLRFWRYRGQLLLRPILEPRGGSLYCLRLADGGRITTVWPVEVAVPAGEADVVPVVRFLYDGEE